jgi:hypothetical protein
MFFRFHLHRRQYLLCLICHFRLALHFRHRHFRLFLEFLQKLLHHPHRHKLQKNQKLMMQSRRLRFHQQYLILPLQPQMRLHPRLSQD